MATGEQVHIKRLERLLGAEMRAAQRTQTPPGGDAALTR